MVVAGEAGAILLVADAVRRPRWPARFPGYMAVGLVTLLLVVNPWIYRQRLVRLPLSVRRGGCLRHAGVSRDGARFDPLACAVGGALPGVRGHRRDVPGRGRARGCAPGPRHPSARRRTPRGRSGLVRDGQFNRRRCRIGPGRPLLVPGPRLHTRRTPVGRPAGKGDAVPSTGGDLTPLAGASRHVGLRLERGRPRTLHTGVDAPAAHTLRERRWAGRVAAVHRLREFRRRLVPGSAQCPRLGLVDSSVARRVARRKAAPSRDRLAALAALPRVVAVVLAVNAIVWAAVWLPQVPGQWLRTSSAAASTLDRVEQMIPGSAQVIASQGVLGRLCGRQWCYPISSDQAATYSLHTRQVYVVVTPYQGIETSSVPFQLSVIGELAGPASRPPPPGP